MRKTDAHILVFDSGIGGLGVADCIRRMLPAATLGYVADTAGFPYGAMSDEALVTRVLTVLEQAIARLRPDMVVIACNTASTLALSALRSRHDLPFIGCVPPLKWAASVSATRQIGLLATPATVDRPYLTALMQEHGQGCTLHAYGARHLAGYAEAVFRGETVLVEAVRAELGILGMIPDIDAVALGCTHYGRLLPWLRQAMPRPVAWLDPAEAVARQAARIAITAAATAAPDSLPRAAPCWAQTVFTTGAVPDEATRQAWAAEGFPEWQPLEIASACAG
ncbi:glutamate racemase [Granulibacter bethesdensis]|uniref:glutamate racemase n=1 Tax=Granulibacter bethesdensis TaxID=364410 RepID=UPI00090AA50C|nr:glutamate racemase [Granulibacter bethesdensis]APH59201.1 Glutamate racemase [Granulibacter bethesdensis]